MFIVFLGGAPKMSREEMRDAELPLSERDWCGHYAVAANKCRRENNWLPWRCGHEKHDLQHCRMDLLKDRMRALKVLEAREYQRNIREKIPTSATQPATQ